MPTADTISLVLHLSLEHLDNKGTYVRLLLIDYSSTIKTIIPNRLISKLQDLGNLAIRTLTNYYRCTIESILAGCIMAWYSNCSAQDRKKLQKVVCTAQ
eukprot:g35935.t1